MKVNNMNLFEFKILLSVCAIFSLRIFGMYIVLPVLSTYGTNLQDSNMTLIGLSIGIYGFFQVLFQVPYGWLSDKFGRKQIIIMGLLFFLVGSIISWNSKSIWGVIVGRGLQGSGAISSVCMALLSDYIRTSNRIKAMSCLGICFGVSFIVAIVISSVLTKFFSLKFLFGFSSCLAVVCLYIAITFIPFKIINNVKCINIKNEIKNLIFILNNYDLFKLNLSIFIVHFLLISNFIIIPIQLKLLISTYNISWMMYTLIFSLSFLVVFPVIYYFRTNQCIKYILSISKLLLLTSNFVFLFFDDKCIFILLGLQMFFIAFSFFEIILPTLVSKISLINYKGTTMAIYSMSQFLGSAIGSFISGVILNYFSIYLVFLLQSILILFWCVNDIKFNLNKTIK